MKKQVLSLLLFLLSLAANAQFKYPFQNPKLSDEKRLDNLISILTQEEKVKAVAPGFSFERLGINGGGNVEGIHGLVIGGPAWDEKRGPVTFTTTFPQAYGLGEMWDAPLLNRVAEHISIESRFLHQNPKIKKSGLIIWSPNADLGRDPRWGRTEECYGEDAFLTATLVTSFVKGLQGNHPKYWRCASLMKHFLANSNEVGRSFTSSNFDDRLFREYYSFPFYKGIKEGGANALMTAYNAYNGIPCTVHPMLRNILMKEWGFNGIILTDGGAFQMLKTDHKYYSDMEVAAAECLKAGTTRYLDKHKEEVEGAIKRGLISDELLSKSIRGNFRITLKLGMLDNSKENPYSGIGVTDTIDPRYKAETRELVRLVTRKSVVLLKNSNNLLPLNKKSIKRIAVIGPRANEVLLDWYSGTPAYAVTPLQGIKNAVGSSVEVLYVKDNKLDSAVMLARKADVVIVCVGNHPVCDAGWEQTKLPSDGKEAVDRTSLELEQTDLVKLVQKANPNTVAVLISSFPYAINWMQEKVPAIVHMAHGSQELGNGLADVLFGDYNPAGRLTQTWVKSIDDLPDMLDYDLRKGRTYQYFKGAPLYPFGFGLSYTSFRYKTIDVPAALSKTGVANITVEVENTGARDGEEVVQLYVKFPESKVQRPQQALKGFARVFIPKGESRKITIPLKAEDLAYWNVQLNRWEVEPASVQVGVGASSADIRLTKMMQIR